MRHPVVLLGTSALFLFVGTAMARAQEEVVPSDKIPKAVMTALLAKFPKAKIDKCTKAKEGDDVVYDIEFKQDGRKCEADIKENGTYINYEVAIEAKELPKVVRDAIDKKYPKATLKDIMEEKEVKGGGGKAVRVRGGAGDGREEGGGSAGLPRGEDSGGHGGKEGGEEGREEEVTVGRSGHDDN